MWTSHMPADALVAFEPRKTPIQARSTLTVEAISEATIQVLLRHGAERLTIRSAPQAILGYSATWSVSSPHFHGTHVPGGGAVHSIITELMHRSKRHALDRRVGAAAGDQGTSISA